MFAARRFTAIIFAICAIVSVSVIQAQTTSGNITGTVTTRADNAALPGTIIQSAEPAMVLPPY